MFPHSSTRGVLSPITVGILFSFLLIMTAACPSSVQAVSTEVAQVGGTYAGWPAVGDWWPIGSLNDPDDGNAAQLEFVGNSTYPGFYYYYNAVSGYIFFRTRMKYSGTLTTVYGSPFNSGTILVMINTGSANPPHFAFAWDMQSSDNAKHGLEMTVISTRGVSWNQTWFDDVDAQSGQKIAPPDFAATGGDGYIRTIDQQSTTTWGYTTFVDFAISCDYLQNRSGTTLRCGQNWKLQLGSISNANDHNKVDGDIGGGYGPSDSPDTSWPPTQAVISSFKAAVHDGKVAASWETASEVGTAGFNLYRVASDTGEYVQVNSNFIPGLLETPQGGAYSVTDPSATPGETLIYLLEEIELRGGRRTYGPFTVTPRVGHEAFRVGTGVSDSAYSREARSLSSSSGAGRTGTSRSAITKAVSRTLKIGVKESGLYRLDAAEIASAMGLGTNAIRNYIRMNRMNLSNNGEAVATLAASDRNALYFYGEAINSIYTDVNVYRLTIGPGTPMPVSGQASGLAAAPGTIFVERSHVEQNLLPFPALFFNPEADFWLWDYVVAGDPTLGAKSFPVRSDGANGTGTLTVALYGLTSSGGSSDHHIALSLNGTILGGAAWTGSIPYTVTFPVADALLVDGENTVELKALLDAGVPYSIVALQSFDLAYQRLYRAYGDSLLLRGDGNTEVLIDGFSTPTIWVFDLKEPRLPARVGNTATGGVPGNGWVRFSPTDAERPYLTVSPSAAMKPFFVLGADDALSRRRVGAEYVIITDPQLQQAASELAAFRKGKGLRTTVVTTEEIYDAFSWGIATPHAIKDFLKYALLRWRPVPRYVVLAGEGSFDYKNVRGFDDSLVPTLLTTSPYGLFPADGHLVDVVDDDGIPDLPVGRIPALSNDQLRDYITKLSQYKGASGSWLKRVMLVADDPDTAGDFPADSDGIAQLVPAAFVTEKIYMPDLSAADARLNLLEGLNEGAYLVNYIGHSGYDRLAGEGLLTKADVPLLGNGARMPVFLAMTCLIGNFGLPGFESLGETLVKGAGGGAISVWAPTSLVTNEESRGLDVGLWKRLFLPGTKTLGQAIDATIKEYAATGVAPYVLQTYTLLGDPALELRK